MHHVGQVLDEAMVRAAVRSAVVARVEQAAARGEPPLSTHDLGRELVTEAVAGAVEAGLLVLRGDGTVALPSRVSDRLQPLAATRPSSERARVER